jgi:hypothetical protein
MNSGHNTSVSTANRGSLSLDSGFPSPRGLGQIPRDSSVVMGYAAALDISALTRVARGRL